nr:unnamed protein product [Callosobruchus chinensis]
MSHLTIQFEKMCRTCLSETATSKSIFTLDTLAGEALKLGDMITSFASVQISSSDGLPGQVCYDCAVTISKSFYFKQLCEQSDVTLRGLLHHSAQSALPMVKPLVVSESPSVVVLQNIELGQVDELNPHKSTNADTVFDNFEVSDEIEADDHTEPDFQLNDASQNEPENKFKNDTDNTIDKSDNGLLEDETNQPIFACEECTECFVEEADLKDHMRIHKQNYSCKVCGQKFSSASTLCRHTNVHDPSKKHECKECGKRFSRSDDLRRHHRTHTGEKPFQCELCDKAFSQSFRLLEHKRAHADEKTFVCSICGKAFSRYTSLLAHNKTHSGTKSHLCSVCGERLCGAGSLALHMKIHTGVKDHICPFCDKAFTTSSNLTIHKRIHTGMFNLYASIVIDAILSHFSVSQYLGFRRDRCWHRHSLCLISIIYSSAVLQAIVFFINIQGVN